MGKTGHFKNITQRIDGWTVLTTSVELHECIRYHSSPVHQLRPEKAGRQPKEASESLESGL